MAIHEILKRAGANPPPKRLSRTKHADVSDVIEENICAVTELRRAANQEKSREDRVADAITALSGDMKFLYGHVIWFGGWFLLNIGDKPIIGFDPYPFGFLTMIVSLEAIFLSTFVLISQNKMAEVSDKRADLDLQINLLSEYEITRLLRLVDAMAEKLGVEEALDPSLQQLETAVAPGDIMAEISAKNEEARKS